MTCNKCTTLDFSPTHQRVLHIFLMLGVHSSRVRPRNGRNTTVMLFFAIFIPHFITDIFHFFKKEMQLNYLQLGVSMNNDD